MKKMYKTFEKFELGSLKLKLREKTKQIRN